jgi:DNA-binding NarL/FixJ family response regulator
MIKVYIVDDHSVVIEGIKSVLLNDESIEVVGFANTSEKCLQFFEMHTANVILMDISLPDFDGIELCKLITQKQPQIKVLALSTFEQGTYIRKMMESGASGYLLKNSSKQEIIEAIKTVYSGGTYLCFEAGRALKQSNEEQNKLPSLTKREKEVLLKISEGFTNAQISEMLFISIDTVDSHRKNLHSKLNVKNTAMLIKFAIENNLL